MIKLVTKTTLIKVNIFLLFTVFVFIACQSVSDERNQSKTENESLPLKRIILDMEDANTGKTFSMEMDYPQNWNTNRISNNVFHASESSELKSDDFVNNFHAIVFNDSLNRDIKTYSNNFLIKEQHKFPQANFEVVRSENLRNKKGIIFQIDQVKIWGGSEEDLFSISALAKVNKRIVHINFYSTYEEKEALERLAKDIVKNVRITG